MSNLKVFLPKDDQELPDSYNVEIQFIGGKTPMKIELASHEFVDKTYIPTFETQCTKDAKTGLETKKTVFLGMKPFGVHHAPYVEIKTTNDETLVIPMINIQSLSFDKNWSKIVELRKKAKLDAKN